MKKSDEFISYNRSGKLSSKIKYIVQLGLSMPKTLYVNFRLFNFSTAKKLPLLINYKTSLIEIKRGGVVIDGNVSRFMIQLGFGGSDGIIARRSSLCIEGGKITFYGKAIFSSGTSIRNRGQMSFGNNFFCNKNCTLWCSEGLSIDADVLFGWNVMIRDDDGHLIIYNGIKRQNSGPIVIGKHTWICSETHLLKGTGIGNNCVLAYNSLLTKKYNSDNVLIAGHPAKIIKTDINWEHG